MNLIDIHALWVGNKLGEISRCCLSSFVMRGHSVFLHTYNEIEDLPQGVIILDANLIIPKNNIIKHKKTGSYALFSDIFRYELLKKIDGLYVDCDVYCLKPIEKPESGYLLGFEDDKLINGAVLSLPKDSKVLSSLTNAAYDPYFIPPWYSKTKQFRLKLKKLLGFGKGLEDMPWGVIGPKAITYYIKKLLLEKNVSSIDIFYPVHYNCVSQLFDPKLSVMDVTTSRTLCIHLYNEMLKNKDLHNLHPNCLMYKLLNNQI